MDANKPELSEREKYGLRGAVKTCVEERTYPGVISGDGTRGPEITHQHTTEYDEHGHPLLRSNRNSNGSFWIMRHTYDASGRLLKTASGNEGEPVQETVYSYDHQGRPLEITTSGKPDPVRFHYDEHGKKTKVQVSRPEDYRPNVAMAGDSPFWAADHPPNMAGGGTATTIYDEQDRPVEVVVRDSEGEVFSRTVRTYNAEGRVSEEKSIMENVAMIIPAERRAEILKESGATLEQLSEHLAKGMHGRMGRHSVAFSYDAHARETQKRRQMWGSEQVVETTYNEQGDPAVKVTQGTRLAGDLLQPESTPEYSEVRYGYQYDSHGNWTEQKTSFRSSPDGEFRDSTTVRRTLTYY